MTEKKSKEKKRNRKRKTGSKEEMEKEKEKKQMKWVLKRRKEGRKYGNTRIKEWR